MVDYEELQRLLAENRKTIGQREADIPKIYEKYSPATDKEIADARAVQAAKVQELFKYDTQLAQTTFEPKTAPGPTATGAPPVTPEPMIIDPTIGLRAANTQTMATAQEAIDIGQQISKRKDYLSESLDKALRLFQIGMQIKEVENAAIQQEMDNYFKMQDLVERRKTTDKTSTDKTKYGQYLAYFLSNEVGSREEALASAREIAAKNPEDGAVVLGIANELFPEKKITEVDPELKMKAKADILKNLQAHTDAVLTNPKDAISKEEFYNQAYQTYSSILTPQETRDLINANWPLETTPTSKNEDWGKFWESLGFGGMKFPVPEEKKKTSWSSW